MRRAADLVALAALLGATTVTALSAGACRRGAPLESCRDSLAGSWRVVGSGEHGAPVRRWALIDRGTRVEGYPLFDDTDAVPASDLVRSPRSLALIRSHTSLVGHVERWVMRGAQKCALRAATRIFDCQRGASIGAEEQAGDSLADSISVQLGALPIPDDLTTCIAAPAQPSAPAAPERWVRER